MKVLTALFLSVGICAAVTCEDIIEFMRKCADYGIDYGVKDCVTLEKEVYKEIHRATGLIAQSKVLANSCYNACVMQAKFYEVVDSIYAVCKKRGR